MIGMSDETPNPFDGFACFSIYSANLAVTRLYADLLQAKGLTYPQYLVMVALARQDEQTVGQLGAALRLESSTLTPLLKRMEAAGWIARRRDKQDERVVRIALSEEGRTLTRELECIPGQILEASGMSVEELVQMKAQLDRLTGHLRARKA